MQNRNIVLKFEPVLPCEVGYRCGRATNLGRLEIEGSEYSLEPACPEHGYMWATTEEDEQASIERYVLWRHHMKGKASYIDTCPLEGIPNYEADPQAHHLYHAWTVLYQDEQGQATRYYVVWVVEVLTFDLFDEQGFIEVVPASE
jgi:hypothetical protein